MHQFKVEFYSLRWALLAWAVIFSMISWLMLTAWDAELKDGFWLLKSIYMTTMYVFVGICLFLLTVLTQVRDLFLDKRAQWNTRPMPAITIYGAKALLVLVCVMVPVSILFCLVYLPIAGWPVTGMMLFEIWVWGLCVILAVTFFNVQYSWFHTLGCFGCIGGGVLILEKIGVPMFSHQDEWIYSYVIIILFVVLGLLYLALFRGKKRFPLWPCWCVCVVLIALHAIPLGGLWATTMRFDFDDFHEFKAVADRSVNVKAGSGTGSSSANMESTKFDTYSYQFELPKSTQGIEPDYIHSGELILSINGINVEPEVILPVFEIHHTHGRERVYGDHLWSNYLNLTTDRRSVSKSYSNLSMFVYGGSKNRHRSGDSKVILSDIKARVTGHSVVRSNNYRQIFTTKLRERDSQNKDGVHVSWKPEANGGELDVKVVNTGLMLSPFDEHDWRSNSYPLDVVLVNHQKREWIRPQMLKQGKNGGGIYVETHLTKGSYTTRIDLAATEKKWGSARVRRGESKYDVDFSSWFDDCELYVYRKTQVSDSRMDVDIEVFLPQDVVGYLKKKGIK